MSSSKPLPDMRRTWKALQAYDKHEATHPFTVNAGPCNWTSDQWLEWFAKSDQLGEAVGVAFGLDTADRNNQEDCRRLIRPGKFVRGCVLAWLESNPTPHD